LVENVVHVLSAQNRRHPLTNDTCSGVSHEVAMISQLYPFTGSGRSWYAFLTSPLSSFFPMKSSA
jgi:hypothetical protein